MNFEWVQIQNSSFIIQNYGTGFARLGMM